MKEGTFLRRMHPVLTPKLYFRISMIFYTALSTNRKVMTIDAPTSESMIILRILIFNILCTFVNGENFNSIQIHEDERKDMCIQ